VNHDFLILIVDDSRVNRLALSHHLQGEGYSLVEASGGEEALAVLAERDPDLILLDVVMPGMSGFDICQTIRNTPGKRDTPVIFITSLDTPEDKLHGLELGAVDFITKPFDPAEIRARVRNQARMRELYCAILEARDRMARELRTARQVQRNFLPDRDRPMPPGVRFDYVYMPSDELGGDFFNIFPLDDRRVVFYISDVSGHGAGSALMTIFAETFFSSHAPHSPDPAQLLTTLNTQFFREKLEEKYITAFLGVLDLERSLLTWSAAGNAAPPLLFGERRMETLAMNSFPVGLVDGTCYANRQVSAPPGTSLLLYSDGLTDVCRDRGECALDEARLREFLESGAGLATEDLLQEILRLARQDVPLEQCPDDITLAIINRE
jgi:sigma-B regulation protein RsbU (phosphoserine phosphatase)